MRLGVRLLAAGLLLAAVGSGVAPAAAQRVPVACTAGSSGIGDGYFPQMGNSGYDVRSYGLDLDVDVDAGSIRQGTATILAIAGTNLCRFNLDLNGLEVDGVTVNGAPTGWARQGQELVVTPLAPITAGAEFVAEVRYHGTPFTIDAPSVEETIAAIQDFLGAGGGDAAGATPVAASAAAVADDAEGLDAAEVATDPALVETGAVLAEEAAPDEGDGGTVTIGQGADVDRYGRSLGGWWKGKDAVFVAGEPRGAETWYPVNGHPQDKATYSFRITVDEPYIAVANGELFEVVDNGDTRTYVWTARDAMPSYLTTLFAGRGEYVQTLGDDGRSYRYAYGAGAPAWQREQLERLTPEIVDFYSKTFGEYPYEVAGGLIVDAMLSFALETQTMPLYGAQIEVPELGMTRESLETGFEGLVAHELAHQWFGNWVTPLRWQDIVLSEGMTSYAAALWKEHRQGRAAMEQSLRESYDKFVLDARINDPEQLAAMSAAELWTELQAGLGPILPQIEEAVFARLGVSDASGLTDQSAADLLAALEGAGLPVKDLFPAPVLPGNPGNEQVFSSAVYERGALMMHALRQEVGDEAFFMILNVWTGTYGYGNATVEDLVAVANTVTGRDLGPFFDAWLFQPDLPPLAFPSLEDGATPAAAPTG